MNIPVNVKKAIDNGDFYDYTKAIMQSNLGMLAGAIYYLHNDASDIGGYKLMGRYPSDVAESTVSVTLKVADGEQLIKAFASGVGDPNIGMIEAGVWLLDVWCSATLSDGDTKITAKFYKRNAGGVETELLSVTTDSIESATPELWYLEAVKVAIDLDLTDRLVVKYFATTTSPTDVTVSIYFEGITHYSKVHTPLAVEGYSGFSGYSGYSGFSGISGYSGYSGISGYSGYSGISGYSGYSGISGYSGYSGTSGYSGYSGRSGYSGYSGNISGHKTISTMSFAVVGVLTTGNDKAPTLVAPCALTITKVKLVSKIAPVGANIIVDVNKNGTTIFTTQANRPNIVDGATQGDSGVPDVTSLAEGDKVIVDIDQIGSATAGSDLTVEVVCEQSIS